MIERDNIIGQVNKTLQSSKGLCNFIRALELTTIIPGKIYENVVNAYLKSDNVPI